MDLETCHRLIEEWRLKGLFIGTGIGLILEVALIRATKTKIDYVLSFASVICVGIIGWITFDMAKSALPSDPWKWTAVTAAISANTWIAAKAVLEGTAVRLFAEFFLPKKFRVLLQRRQEDKADGKDSRKG